MSLLDTKALNNGMIYRIEFPSGQQSIYVRTLSAIGPAVREVSPYTTFHVVNLHDLNRLTNRINAI